MPAGYYLLNVSDDLGLEESWIKSINKSQTSKMDVIDTDTNINWCGKIITNKVYKKTSLYTPVPVFLYR